MAMKGERVDSRECDPPGPRPVGSFAVVAVACVWVLSGHGWRGTYPLDRSGPLMRSGSLPLGRGGDNLYNGEGRRAPGSFSRKRTPKTGAECRYGPAMRWEYKVWAAGIRA